MINKYIWLNPIVESILRETGNTAKRILEDKGYRIVTCTSGAPRVREAYSHYINNASKKPVIDARCPKITALIEEKYPQLEDSIAPIPPILVACTEALYEKHIKPDPRSATLTVIAPCSWLVNEGSAVFGERVRFVTWRQFCEEMGLGDYPQLMESPVPPGFFKEMDLPVLEASGKQKTEKLLELACTDSLPEGISLLELLYCEEGCHRGDGM